MRLRSIASAAIDKSGRVLKKHSERSKFACWEQTARRSYLSLHRFLTMAGQLAISLKTSWSLTRTSHIPSTDHR